MRTYSLPELDPSASYDREPSSDVKIRFRDCDPLGHLHNTRFADYMLDAREDHLRDVYGIDLVDWAQSLGVGWVVTSSKIRHFAPGAVSERVRIFTRLISFDEKTLHVEARMYGAAGELKALLWWSFRAIDTRTGKTREHDSRFMKFCEGVVHPVLADTFDERVRTVSRTLAE